MEKVAVVYKALRTGTAARAQCVHASIFDDVGDGTNTLWVIEIDFAHAPRMAPLPEQSAHAVDTGGNATATEPHPRQHEAAASVFLQARALSVSVLRIVDELFGDTVPPHGDRLSTGRSVTGTMTFRHTHAFVVQTNSDFHCERIWRPTRRPQTVAALQSCAAHSRPDRTRRSASSSPCATRADAALPRCSSRHLAQHGGTRGSCGPRTPPAGEAHRHRPEHAAA